jgi:hypothetical protein
MDRDEQLRLLTAYAVATYATTLAGLEALQRVGVAVGYSTIGAVRRGLTAHAHSWDAMHGNHLWDQDRLDRIVGEARAYCTEHQAEVDALESRDEADD